MKKILPFLIFLMSFFFTVEGEAFKDSTFNEQRVITVSDEKEFLLALGSDRTIIMQPGYYELTKFDPHDTKEPKSEFINEVNKLMADNGVEWRGVADGGELILTGINNLTIRGNSFTDITPDTRIVVEPRYAFVMQFKQCNNISVERIFAGHTMEGLCSGGVLGFEECTKIKLSQVNLYGCGTDGLLLNNVFDVHVDDSKIFNCTNSIITASNSEKMLLSKCMFYFNGGLLSYLIALHDTKNATFDSCHINRNAGQMFSVDELSKNIVVRKSVFAENGDQQIKNSHNVKFVGCSFY